MKNIKAAMLIGMFGMTIASYLLNLASLPETFIEIPSLMLFPFDFDGFYMNFNKCISCVMVLLFVSIFDTAGVQYACGQCANLLENDKLKNSKQAFMSASIATIAGACIGTSPVIIHNETMAGIQDGGRTGLNAVVVGICFIICLPIAPLLLCIPGFTTGAPLVLVGMFMMSVVKFINWDNIEEAFPAFITCTILPLTYSIANGMVCGLIAYACTKGILILDTFCQSHRITHNHEHEHNHKHGHGHNHGHKHSKHNHHKQQHDDDDDNEVEPFLTNVQTNKEYGTYDQL